VVGDADVVAAPGGGIVAPEEGVKEIGIEVKAAAEGEIIDTMPGAYFFALSKKGFLFSCPRVLSCTQFSPAP
jgi:hypothetical protein